MSVYSIVSTIECDDCAVRFRVELDPAYRPPAGWTVFDISEDRVRGGSVLGESMFGSCSVQGGRMLCIACTEVEDAKYPDAPAPTSTAPEVAE